MHYGRKILAYATAGALILLCPVAHSAARYAQRAPASPSTFGPLVGADSLDNFQIGGPRRGILAYRFRAPWTGTVNSVRFFAILNTEERPSGYSGGTGGTFRVSLVSDTGGSDGRPGHDVLANADYVPARDNLFPRLRFSTPAPVQRGRYYDLVFTNVDQDPEQNFASVNTLYIGRPSGTRPPSVPADVSLLWAHEATGLDASIAWTRDRTTNGDDHLPSVEISGGAPLQHIGYGYMEVWSENAKPIGGAAGVRERFVFDRLRPARVTKAWFRLRRTSADAAPLQLSLQTQAGRVLATTTSSARRIRFDSPAWVTASFAQPPILQPGQVVAFVARAATPRSYEAFPVRDGSMFGFGAATVFRPGYAQFNSGGGWKGWDQWGKYDRHDGDLQFGLALEPVG